MAGRRRDIGKGDADFLCDFLIPVACQLREVMSQDTGRERVPLTPAFELKEEAIGKIRGRYPCRLEGAYLAKGLFKILFGNPPRKGELRDGDPQVTILVETPCNKFDHTYLR
jgi:hypothetical protein